MRLTLATALLVSTATACSSSSSFDSHAALAQLASPLAEPGALAEPCEGPAELPDGGMTVGQVRTTMGHDRAALSECKARHGALADFYAKVRQGVAGK